MGKGAKIVLTNLIFTLNAAVWSVGGGTNIQDFFSVSSLASFFLSL